MTGEARQPREPERTLGPDGFEKWARAVFWTSELRAIDKVVVAVIATRDWFNVGDGCTLSIPHIARLVGAAEKTVRKALRHLEATGVITSEERSGVSGSRTSNSVRIDRRRCVRLLLPAMPGVILDPGGTSAPTLGLGMGLSRGQEGPHPGGQNRPRKSVQLKSDAEKTDQVKTTSAGPAGVTAAGAVTLSADLAVETVYRYWRDTMGKDPARTRLGDKRRELITDRLQENGGDVSELLYAVDGATQDEYLMGRNDSGTRWDGLETILRDRGQVERLYERVADPEKVHPFLEPAARAAAARRRA